MIPSYSVILLPLLILIPQTQTFSISSSSSDIGHTEDTPARSGDNAQSIELRCELEFNPGESWTRCTWSHSFEDIWAPDHTKGYIMCSCGYVDEDGGTCEDRGNLRQNFDHVDPEMNPWTRYDVERLAYSIGEDYCGLTIKNPHANDTGVWKCQVNDNTQQSTTMWAEVQVFVANQSVVEITKPDLEDESMAGIELDLSTGNNQVDAECRAQYGIPPPTIVWYIDESSNTLDSSLSSDRSTSDGSVVSTVSFTVDTQLLSRYGVSEVNSYFTLSLGCLPDQGDYFTDSSDFAVNPAEVMVYGYSHARGFHSSIAVILTIVMGAKYWENYFILV